MSPTKNSDLAAKVKAKAESRNDEISPLHAQVSSFSIREELFATDGVVATTNSLFNDKILLAYQAGKTRILKLKDKERQFRILAANLTFASRTRPLRVSLDTNHYKSSRRLSTFFIFLVNWLHDNGYVTMLKGTYFDSDGGKMWTRIIPTGKFKKELLSKVTVRSDSAAMPDKYLLQLRDVIDEKKTVLHYKETKFTRQLKAKLRLINSCNDKHLVTLWTGKKKKDIITDLHAVFSGGSFEKNGRFYTGRFGYQNLHREDRPELRIDGQRTVELDFSGFHPRLLYALKGIQYDRDPYVAVTEDRTLRPILKKLLLAIFNTEYQYEAVRSGNKTILEDGKLYSDVERSGYTIKQLVEMFKTAHEPIADYFFTGQGLRLMNIDSQIALGVLSHFADRKEACLCIHDSFIVEERLESELMEVMQENYGKNTEKYSPDNRHYYCKIDRK